MRRPLVAHCVIALALLAAANVLPAEPAGAAQGTGNPVLAVSASTLPADRVSTITVTGTDYLVPPHAPGVDVFGGVYVFVGWVADPGRFGPSIRNSGNNDGTFGVTYAYPGDGGDPSTRDDGTGTMRLVSFTPGGESGNATDFHMDDNGNWSTTVRIFGSTFTTTNPSTGETRTYDCQQVRCGVFTIGAHGKASATNERFTPLTFSGRAPAQPITPSAPGTSGGRSDPDAPGPGSSAGGSDAGESGSAGGGAQAGGGSGNGGDGGPTAAAPTDVTAADPTVSGGSSGDADTGDEADEEGLAVGISSTRDTGGGAARLVVGAAAVAGVAAGAVLWRRRRRGAAGAPAADPP